MSNAVYERYRDRLTALAPDTLLLAVLAAAGQQQKWWPAERSWRRTYGRFHPQQAPYVTLVYETVDAPQEICLLEIFEACPGETDTTAIVLCDPHVGWLRMRRFPADPLLHTLPTVLAASGQPTIVRYRPYLRCTLRVVEGARVRFAKVYADAYGAQVHRAGLALWQAAGQGELGFMVAQPDRWDQQTCTLWQEAIPGTPVMAQLLGVSGSSLAYRLGQAAASLTVSHVAPEEHFDGTAQLARSALCAQELHQCLPSLAPTVEALLDRLSDLHASVGPRQLRPIHGAPHAHQWLDDGTRLGLVDFDRLSWGDPELDVATFLAEMDFESELQVPIEQLANAFLTGYSALAGPLDRRLLVAYRAHKRLAKTLRSARSVRPDGDQRAARHLQRAWDCLQGDLG